MAKRKKKTKGIGKLFTLGVLLVCAVAAGAYYVGKKPFGVKPPAQKPTVTVTPTENPVAVQRIVYIYLPQQGKNGIFLARVPATTNDKGDELDAAMKALLETNKREGMAQSLIPKGTRLLTPVEVKGAVATVNLSHEFVDNFSGGSDQEALTVNSIAHTLVSNSGGKASSVRILVEGEAIETLGGHLELTDPVKADSTLLRPGSMK